MLNYTCAKCNIELRCKRNGITLVHYINNNESEGIDCIRFGDLYICSVCGLEVIVGLSNGQLYGKNAGPFVKSAKKSNTLIEIKRNFI